MLTSVTTGPPKRRCRCLSGISRATRPAREPRARPDQRGVAISAVPLVSMGGVMGAAAAVWKGRPTALLERFDIWRWAEMVSSVQTATVGRAAGR